MASSGSWSRLSGSGPSLTFALRGFLDHLVEQTRADRPGGRRGPEVWSCPSRLPGVDRDCALVHRQLQRLEQLKLGFAGHAHLGLPCCCRPCRPGLLAFVELASACGLTRQAVDHRLKLVFDARFLGLRRTAGVGLGQIILHLAFIVLTMSLLAQTKTTLSSCSSCSPSLSARSATPPCSPGSWPRRMAVGSRQVAVFFGACVNR